MLGMVCELPTACSSWLKPEQASTRNRELYGGQTCQTSNKSAQKNGLLAHARTLNPPTPAFAKAGAAPGTTAGVELFRAGFKCARQLPPSLAAAFAGPGLQPRPLPAHPSRQCARQLPPSLAAAFAGPGLQPGPLPAHPSRQLPPSSWPSAFQHCSLPFACT